MKTYMIQDIRDLKPCYDPTRYLPENWQGTAANVLRVEACPSKDRLWVISHWLDNKTLRLFAVWCMREALKLVDNPDLRLIAACDIAEQFANGVATQEELAAASAAAWAAANAADWDPADWDAAWDIACAVARATAWDAARAATSAADWAATWAAARAADWDAAKAAAKDAQITKLLEMIEA
jgi:hypothetical protein